MVRVLTPCSRLGNFLKAFLLSVCTAFGVLIRTRLVSWGKNFPRCQKREREEEDREERREDVSDCERSLERERSEVNK